ncbi:MAG: hypothetical protein HY814_01735 [Candidatus Riflebacteria bacterium]|nr:hypothetical protein [Candidatus Riflebacteria bacterium]
MIRLRTFSLVALVMLAGCCAGGSVAAAPIHGCWLVPESVFSDDRTYALEERRDLVGRALDRMKRHGIDSVFLESFVRGHATSRCSVAGTVVPVPLRYLPAVRTEPDLLDLFIALGRERDMAVHAWVHALYLRSDNLTRVREDDEVPTLFHDLLVTEFRTLRDKTEAQSSVRRLVDTVLEATDRGFDTRSLAVALRDAGFGFSHSPMQQVVDSLTEAGLAGPAIFVYGPGGRLHPPLDTSTNGSLYLDPAHAQVRSRLLDLCQSLVDEHPGLAGLHLDHIRFPEGGFGYDAQASGGDLQYVAPETGSRERALSTFVAECRSRVLGKVAVSAAVVPGYYLDWQGAGGSERGTGQAWFGWDLSFYTPMLYGVSGERKRSALASYKQGLGGKAPVYPGISSLDGARTAGWVLFDYGTLLR